MKTTTGIFTLMLALLTASPTLAAGSVKRGFNIRCAQVYDAFFGTDIEGKILARQRKEAEINTQSGLGGGAITGEKGKIEEPEDNSLVGQFMRHPKVKSLTDAALQALGDLTGRNLEPEELRSIETVAQVGERFVAKRSSGLLLVRNKALIGRDYEVIELRGRDFLSARVIGGYQVILTSTPATAESPILYHVNLVNKGNATPTIYDSSVPVHSFEMENSQGTAIAVGKNVLFFNNVKDAETGQTKQVGTVSGFHSNVLRFENVTINDLEFLKVDHENGIHYYHKSLFEKPQGSVMNATFSEYGSIPAEFMRIGYGTFLVIQAAKIEGKDETSITAVRGFDKTVYAASGYGGFAFRPSSLKLVKNTGSQMILEVDRIFGINRYVVVDQESGWPKAVTMLKDNRQVLSDGTKTVFLEIDKKESSTFHVFPDKDINSTIAVSDPKAPPLPKKMYFSFPNDDVHLVSTPGGISENPNRMFVKVGIKGERKKIGDATCLIDLRTRQTIVLGEVLDVKNAVVNGVKHYIVTSREVGTGRIGLTVVSEETGAIVAARPSERSEPINGSGVFAPKILPFETVPGSVTVKVMSESSTLVISGTVKDQHYKNALTLVRVTNDGVYEKTLFNVYEPQIKGKLADEAIIVAEQEGFYAPERSGSSVVVSINKKSGISTMSVAARIQTMELDGNSVTVKGTRRLLTSDIAVDLRWKVGAKAVDYEIVNKSSTPLYEDKAAGFSIQATEGGHGTKPRLMLVRDNGDVVDIPLSYKVSYEDTTKIDAFMGTKIKTETKTEQIVNEDPISKVDRDGNLLFVTTGATGSEGRTYVYDLNVGKIEVSFPNFQGYRDIDGYRFYVGHPADGTSGLVAVFDRTSNKYITHFDMGQVRIDMTREDAITKNHDTKQIRFRTTTGAVRVFDERQNSFMGFLPHEITSEFKELTQGLGSVLNQTMFQHDSDPVKGREDVMAALQAAHPLNTAVRQGRPKYIVIKGESGAGRTSLLKEYISRYMGGQLTGQDVNMKVVFFEVDPTKIVTGGQLRGNVQDKWSEIRRVADVLTRKGYQLVLVMDNVDTIHVSHRMGQIDNESDVFTNMGQLKEKSRVDVLVTATVHGWDSLNRNNGHFTSGFQEVRLQPMSAPKTAAAMKEYFANRYPGKTVISDNLLEYSVAAVARVNKFRALPGTAFEVVKTVIEETLARSDCKGCMVTREVINRRIASKAGLPEALVDGRPEVIEEFQRRALEFMRSRISGQDDQVEAVVASLSSFALGINQTDIPIMSFLMPGPTGVGKTLTVETLVEFIFGHKGPLLKISGEDYQGPISGQTLHDLKQVIVKHVRENGLNAILFDEIEKMDPKAFKLLSRGRRSPRP